MNQEQPKPVSKVKALLLTAALIGSVIGGQKLYSEYTLRTPQLAVGTCLGDEAQLEGGVKAQVILEVMAVEGKRFKQEYVLQGAILVPVFEELVIPMPIAGSAKVEDLQRSMRNTGRPVVIDCDTGAPIGK
jgi:hypothetical protein